MLKFNSIKTLTAGIALAMALYPQAWAEIVDSGSCGSGGCKFELDDKGNLRIYGSGTVDDYFATPFNTSHPKLATDVKNVVVGKGITGLGRQAFRSCSLESISLPNTLTTIGLAPFKYATNLHKIVIPKSVTYISGNFSDGSSLNDITIEGSNVEIENVDSLGAGLTFGRNAKFSSIPGSETEKRLKELYDRYIYSYGKATFEAYYPPKRTHYTIEEAMEHVSHDNHNSITFTFK